MRHYIDKNTSSFDTIDTESILKLLPALLAASALVTGVLCQSVETTDTTQFHLGTSVKHGQHDKKRFNNLYLQKY